MDELLRATRAGISVIDLARSLHANIPCSPNHPGFRMSLLRRHGDMTRPDGGSASNELIVTGGHVGTHIDALSHCSQDGLLHGGHSAAESQVGGAFSVHGVETIDPMVCRGVLLDVARVHGTQVLPPAHAIGATDLQRAAALAGVVPEAGDVVLVNTGWGVFWDTDPQAYVGFDSGVPGIDEDGARWLADLGVRAVGSDTTAVEQVHAGVGHKTMPVHRILLVESGIHIIEHLRLDELAASEIAEFLFVLSPLKIVGGTGSPVRPLAVMTAA